MRVQRRAVRAAGKPEGSALVIGVARWRGVGVAVLSKHAVYSFLSSLLEPYLVNRAVLSAKFRPERLALHINLGVEGINAGTQPPHLP